MFVINMRPDTRYQPPYDYRGNGIPGHKPFITMQNVYNQPMTYTPESLVNEFSTLVSMPGVCIRVNEMVEDPKYTAVDIGKVISQDPGLTVRLLKIANSPFYGLTSQVDTVSRAVAVLGTKQIRDLVVATSTIQSFKGIPNELITMDNFWFHSIACGLASKKLLAECRPGQGENIFIAGLMHDIGQLVIFSKIPDLAKEALILNMDGEDELELHLAERQIMGFDHAQVGGALAKAWKLPENLHECIEFHHDIKKTKKYPLETAIVHIANSIAVLAELDSTDLEEAPAIDPDAWKITGLPQNIIEVTVNYVKEQISDVQSMLSAA